jgi:hypothetical protein
MDEREYEEARAFEAEEQAAEQQQEEETVTVTVDFPLSIGVVGAPGSGKAEFAEEFARQWDADEFFSPNVLRVLPNGGTRAEELDLAMGLFGDYREHMLALFLSLEDELAARRDGVSFLANGTIFGNLAHAGANYESVMLGLQSAGLVTPETEIKMQQLQATLTAMSFMTGGLRLMFAFYLPLRPQIEVPGEDTTPEERHARRVEQALAQVLNGFGYNLQVLDQPTTEERAATALATVRRIMEQGAQVPASAIPAE